MKEGLKSAEERVGGGADNFNFGGGANPFQEALKNPNLIKLLTILQNDPRTASFAKEQSFLQLLGVLMINPQMATQYMNSDPRLQAAFQVIMSNPEAQ